jgi:hypothetical protein
MRFVSALFSRINGSDRADTPCMCLHGSGLFPCAYEKGTFALLLSAGPGHARCMPSWSNSSDAGAFTWGVNGSNDCPAPSVRIVDTATCQRAAAAAGKTYDGPVIDPSYPGGCAWYTRGSDIYVRLNNAVGAGNPSAVLLCALATAAPTGAPTRTEGSESVAI